MIRNQATNKGLELVHNHVTSTIVAPLFAEIITHEKDTVSGETIVATFIWKTSTILSSRDQQKRCVKLTVIGPVVSYAEVALITNRLM